MTVLDKVRQWLSTYPKWDEKMYIDYTDPSPGNTGVFPQGVQELSRRQDVVGNVTVENRLSFTLLRITAGQQDGQQQAAWLMEFQDWVQQQSAAGKAPIFGDVQSKEKLWAEQGKLKAVNQAGTARYTVRLIAQFTKKYEA